MSNDTFEVEYEVDDGYVGKSAPQRFDIDRYEIVDDMDEEELRELYYDMIQNDFESRITWSDRNVDKFLIWAKEIQEELAAEE